MPTTRSTLLFLAATFLGATVCVTTAQASSPRLNGIVVEIDVAELMVDGQFTPEGLQEMRLQLAQPDLAFLHLLSAAPFASDADLAALTEHQPLAILQTAALWHGRLVALAASPKPLAGLARLFHDTANEGTTVVESFRVASESYYAFRAVLTLADLDELRANAFDLEVDFGYRKRLYSRSLFRRADKYFVAGRVNGRHEGAAELYRSIRHFSHTTVKLSSVGRLPKKSLRKRIAR